MSNSKRAGFTLIELMIVVAIIAIIAAIAIPSLTAARMHGNEASAVSSLRTIMSCNEQYRVRFGDYAGGLSDLGTEGYIDSVLSAGSKQGYDFSYTAGASTWECTAEPVTPSRTGERYFFVDLTGVIRFSTSGTASGADPAID